MRTGYRLVMDCPICLGDAKDETPPTYRGLVLECPRCGLYRVTQDAIAALGTLKVDERLLALRKAKKLLGSRTPTITSGCLGITLSRKTRSRSRSASQLRMPPSPASLPPSRDPAADLNWHGDGREAGGQLGRPVREGDAGEEQSLVASRARPPNSFVID